MGSLMSSTSYNDLRQDRDLHEYAGEAALDLLKMEYDGELSLDTDSVYGLAIAMPQIARSAPNKIFVALAIRSYILLVLNVILQGMLLCFIGQASQIMAALGGQMHLCDFGASLPSCPDGDGCLGPGGTRYTKTRLFGYTQWNVQNFVKRALLDIIPEKRTVIEEKVDPGEYGMENYWCRLVACFLFSMSVITELYSCFELAVTLWTIPSESESWIEERKDVQEPTNESFPGLDFVKFRVAGMPRYWKVINALIVCFPKCFLWWFVVWQGFILLMETAGIIDLVLGSLAMGFICSIDEMILSSLASKAARYVMNSIEPWEVHGGGQVDGSLLHIAWFIFPRRLALCVGITAAFVTKFYLRKCRWDPENKSWVSVDMSYPEVINFFPWDLLDNDWVKTSSRRFWSMPEEGD